MTEQTQPTDAAWWIITAQAELDGVETDDSNNCLKAARGALEKALNEIAKWGTPAGAGEPVAYLDIGTGYLDLGTALSDDELLRLPKGRHALVIAGTYGVDGYTTPQPTQAQAGAVPTRAFLERTLAAMEGVIDVADRKTDEFDALRSCVIDLTLMLFSDAKRQTKGACHER
jgi:hypothetical protein